MLNNSINIITERYATRFQKNFSKELLLAYAAGLIDGEGCIGLYHNSHNGNYQLRITVEMVDKSGMEIISNLFKGKWYYKKAKKPRRARQIWMAFNRNAEDALQQLFPYLIVKRTQAELALKGNWSGFVGGKKLTKKETEIRHEINLKIKKLNQRGYYEENER